MIRLLILLLLLAATRLYAQDMLPPPPPGSTCMSHASLAQQLADSYEEMPEARGMLSPPVAMFELFASRTSGTWSFVITSPLGQSCIIVVGTDFQIRAVGDPA